MQILEQGLEPFLQNERMPLLEQALGQALQRALMDVQGQVQEQTQVQALKAWQVLQDVACRVGLRQTLVQEQIKEFCQVLEQALLERLEQVPEQAFVQGWFQALTKAVGTGSREIPWASLGTNLWTSPGDNPGTAVPGGNSFILLLTFYLFYT